MSCANITVVCPQCGPFVAHTYLGTLITDEKDAEGIRDLILNIHITAQHEFGPNEKKAT